MSFYSRYIFPRVIDFAMSNNDMRKVRTAVLGDVSGDIFEIGFGTGLNLPYYPEGVTKLTAIDSENMLEDRVAKRIASCPLPVTRMRLDAQGRLPFEDHTFDTVVTTLTLCSIPDTAAALAEVEARRAGAGAAALEGVGAEALGATRPAAEDAREEVAAQAHLAQHVV